MLGRTCIGWSGALASPAHAHEDHALGVVRVRLVGGAVAVDRQVSHQQPPAVVEALARERREDQRGEHRQDEGVHRQERRECRAGIFLVLLAPPQREEHGQEHRRDEHRGERVPVVGDG